MIHPETSQLFVCGGNNEDDVSVSTVMQYSILEDKWNCDYDHPVHPMISKRQLHTAVECDGLIYVIGGSCEYRTARGDLFSDNLASCEMFDVYTKQWSKLPPLHQARRSHSSVVHSGKDFKHVYALGGHYKKSAERYDILVRKWEIIPDLPRSRSNHHSVILAGGNGNSTILIIGGYSCDFGRGIIDPKSILQFHIEESKWSIASWSLPEKYHTSSVHLIHDEHRLSSLSLLICGGADGQRVGNSCLRIWLTESGEFIKMKMSDQGETFGSNVPLSTSDQDDMTVPTLPGCFYGAAAC